MSSLRCGFLALVSLSILPGEACADVTLVKKGAPRAQLVVAAEAAAPERFAAEEIQRYVEQMSGARLPITPDVPKRGAALLIGRGLWLHEAPAADPWDDTFTIEVAPRRVILAGHTPRATLYAAYALLERFGCRWHAPDFAFYPNGKGETVPRATSLTLQEGKTVERPAWRYRAKYVEEGLTHTAANLPALVDWMAKTRQNVFSCPTDYGGRGRVRWDAFREGLTPELKKRGLLIEVGGHGYQNFLPASRYFREHPEWFGMDENGRRSRAVSRVFETANPDALEELTRNVVAYLRARPEIDIFDLWPPDGARWSESPESRALGSPAVRHALVVNHVARRLERELPRVTLEFIAYSSYLAPPPGVLFPPNTLVGFCPIGRSFAAHIDDPQSSLNKRYWEALAEWKARADVRGRLYIYSYFRKYAWRSRPVLTPKLIAHDLAKYREVGAIGISSYSEPGDWLTYEVQHLALANAAWERDFRAEPFLTAYCRARFGPAARPMQRFFEAVEEAVPQAAHIPGTAAPAPEALARHQGALARAREALAEAARLLQADAERRKLVERLGIALEYARLDIARRAEPARGEELREQLAALLKAHPDEGLFVTPERIVERFIPSDSAGGRPADMNQ
jgi:uncharacterized protein DUF4838